MGGIRFKSFFIFLKSPEKSLGAFLFASHIENYFTALTDDAANKQITLILCVQKYYFFTPFLSCFWLIF